MVRLLLAKPPAPFPAVPYFYYKLLLLIYRIFKKNQGA
jgi:hypothetical protein